MKNKITEQEEKIRNIISGFAKDIFIDDCRGIKKADGSPYKIADCKLLLSMKGFKPDIDDEFPEIGEIYVGDVFSLTISEMVSLASCGLQINPSQRFGFVYQTIDEFKENTEGIEMRKKSNMTDLAQFRKKKDRDQAADQFIADVESGDLYDQLGRVEPEEIENEKD